MRLNHLLIAMGIVAGGVSGSVAAADGLFTAVENRAMFAEPGPLLRQVAADPANARIEIVGARVDLLSEQSESLRLNLPGGIDVEARRSEFQRMESGNEVWIGEIANERLPAPLARG
jgi:hypothetical protein